MPGAAAPPRVGRAPLAACLLLAACVAGSVAAVPYLPTHDGPQHIYAIHAANHLDAPGTGYREWLEPNLPVTSHGFTALFGPLDLWLPWALATRLALVAMTLLWCAGAFAFVRAVHPGRSWLALPLAAAALQWTLYMGFFSFYVATALGLFVLAAGFGRPRWNAERRALLAGLLFAQALCHVVPAILTGGVLAALALARAAPGERAREAAGLALLGAPAAAVVLALLHALATAEAGPLESSDVALPPW